MGNARPHTDMHNVHTQIDPNHATAAVRRLNDNLRMTGTGGRMLLSASIASLPDDLRTAILEAVRDFTAFDGSNDPHGEHDCAVLAVGDLSILWKIDYYDLDLACLSRDPSDSEQTCRVLTIMRAEDY